MELSTLVFQGVPCVAGPVDMAEHARPPATRRAYRLLGGDPGHRPLFTDQWTDAAYGGHCGKCRRLNTCGSGARDSGFNQGKPVPSYPRDRPSPLCRKAGGVRPHTIRIHQGNRLCLTPLLMPEPQLNAQNARLPVEVKPAGLPSKTGSGYQTARPRQHRCRSGVCEWANSRKMRSRLKFRRIPRFLGRKTEQRIRPANRQAIAPRCATDASGRRKPSFGFRRADSTHICGRATTLTARTTAAIPF